ncbi:MAG: PQQ-like beta-propeller repeat protein [Chloroflexota bacterium]|nr:PQQ-like beta-propeller repeat protein [Chloroflexota bacterium]
MMSISPYRPREMALDSHTSRLFASVAGGLLAIDARTGTLLWRSNKGAESRVEIVKDTVLALNDITFVALESATGAIQWENDDSSRGILRRPFARP